MYIIDVVLFIRTASNEEFSYRSKSSIIIGTIVYVPLRHKTVPAVVTRCVAVRDAKSFLKNAAFTPRTGVIQTNSRLPRAYNEAAHNIAQYHAATYGSVLRQLFTNDEIISGFPARLLNGNGYAETQYEVPYDERIQYYQSLCEEKRHNGTILFIVPSAVEADRLAKQLPSVSIVLTGSRNTKKHQEILTNIKTAPVVITTASHAFVAIQHISSIIIERESATTYQNIRYPHIDMRIALRELARARHVQFVIGDYPIRIEMRTPQNKELQNTYYKNIHLFSTRPDDLTVPEKRYTTITFSMRKMIQDVLNKKGRVLLIATHRGYASTVICKDCGSAVLDKYGRALSLATRNGTRVFRSADGTIILAADIHCNICGSWNLIPLGAGIERVIEDVIKYFPKITLVRFDSDTITSVTAAIRALTKARESQTILIGTERLIPWLDKQDSFSLSMVVSADSLLALPFWRARERFVRIAFSIAQHSTYTLIATRHIKDAACRTLVQQPSSIFFNEEIELRKTLHYPPYGHLIIFRIIGNTLYRTNGEKLIRNALDPHKLICLPDQIITKNKAIRVLICKQRIWPNKELAIRIAKLPQWITHTIDGESIW